MTDETNQNIIGFSESLMNNQKGINSPSSTGLREESAKNFNIIKDILKTVSKGMKEPDDKKMVTFAKAAAEQTKEVIKANRANNKAMNNILSAQENTNLKLGVMIKATQKTSTALKNIADIMEKQNKKQEELEAKRPKTYDNRTLMQRISQASHDKAASVVSDPNSFLGSLFRNFAGGLPSLALKGAGLAALGYGAKKLYDNRESFKSTNPEGMLQGPGWMPPASQTGVGVSGFPSGGSGARGSYDNDATRTSPYGQAGATVDASNIGEIKGTATHPNGEGYSQRYQQDRQRFAEELKDPAIMHKLQSLAETEVGKNPKNQQKWLETVFNRAQFSNKTLGQIINDTGYYPNHKLRKYDDYQKGLFKDNQIANIMKGSNFTKSATDNASNDYKRNNPVADNRIAGGATGEWTGGGHNLGEYLYKGGKNAGEYRTSHGVAAENYQNELDKNDTGSITLGKRATAEQLTAARERLESQFSKASDQEQVNIRAKIDAIKEKEKELASIGKNTGTNPSDPVMGQLGSDRSKDNANRKDYWRSSLTFGDQVYRFGTGAPGANGRTPGNGGHSGSVPFGTFEIRQGLHVGRNPRFQNNSFYVKDMFDPKWGKNRSAILFHSARDIDRMYTAGCFGIDPRQWPKFRAQMLDSMRKFGPMVVQVNKDGSAKIVPKSQLNAVPTETVNPETFINKGQQEQARQDNQATSQDSQTNNSTQLSTGNNSTNTQGINAPIPENKNNAPIPENKNNAPIPNDKNNTPPAPPPVPQPAPVQPEQPPAAQQPAPAPMPQPSAPSNSGVQEASDKEKVSKDNPTNSWAPNVMNYWKNGKGVHV